MKQTLVWVPGSPAHFEVTKKPKAIWTLPEATDPAKPPKLPAHPLNPEHELTDWEMQSATRLLYYSRATGWKQGCWVLLEH